jgi:hypothetical protein
VGDCELGPIIPPGIVMPGIIGPGVIWPLGFGPPGPIIPPCAMWSPDFIWLQQSSIFPGPMW